ncbi:hypothetical protein EVAR_75875_1 [Eumeta japonica]|uniref:Uncharacterized protein n=1 Tax=Eumeta variegata TaxID=151549 RepID=A0A4C1TDD1_EUMVA|nr:hypothetical protein EVAR_75875_1 [Eumeta japonica]
MKNSDTDYKENQEKIIHGKDSAPNFNDTAHQLVKIKTKFIKQEISETIMRYFCNCSSREGLGEVRKVRTLQCLGHLVKLCTTLNVVVATAGRYDSCYGSCGTPAELYYSEA